VFGVDIAFLVFFFFLKKKINLKKIFLVVI
jgi:hypothetical protein